MPAFARLNDVGQLDITKQEVLYLLATLCRATYAPTAQQFTQAAQAAFGPSAAISFVPNGPPSTPGFGICITPSGSALVAISGTTNLNQWLEQTLLGSLVATEFSLSDSGQALATYKTASVAINTVLAGLVPADKDVLITGHSMGGAVGAVLAYQQRQTFRTGETRLVQFAAPKAGTAPLARLIPSSIGTLGRYAIQGDIVPVLPPDPGLFAKAFINGLGPPISTTLNFWAEFVATNQAMSYIDSQGNISFGDEPSIILALTTAILQAAAAQPITVVSNHLMKSFCDNILQGIGSLQPLLEEGWSTPSMLVPVNNTLNNLGL